MTCQFIIRFCLFIKSYASCKGPPPGKDIASAAYVPIVKPICENIAAKSVAIPVSS
jgi:hypothetical protein